MDILNQALLLSSMSMGCFLAGFYLIMIIRGHIKTERRCMRITLENYIVSRLLTMYWVSVAIRLLSLSSGYGTFFVSATRSTTLLSNIIIVLTSLNKFIYPLVLLAIFWNNKGNFSRKILFILLTQLLIGFLVGSKGAVISAVIPFVYFYSFRGGQKNPLNGIIMMVLAASIAITLIAFPIITNYRSISEVPNIKSILSATQTTKTGVLMEVLGRISWLPSISKVIMTVPQYIPYKYGETIWPALIWFVPRVVWPNKPKMSIGSWYAHEILGWNPLSPAEGGITLWGESYLNFGILGMLITGLLMGLFFGYIYRMMYRNMHKPFIILIYFYLISKFILTVQNISIIIASFCQTILISAIIWGIARMKFR